MRKASKRRGPVPRERVGLDGFCFLAPRSRENIRGGRGGSSRSGAGEEADGVHKNFAGGAKNLQLSDYYHDYGTKKEMGRERRRKVQTKQKSNNGSPLGVHPGGKTEGRKGGVSKNESGPFKKPA